MYGQTKGCTSKVVNMALYKGGDQIDVGVAVLSSGLRHKVLIRRLSLQIRRRGSRHTILLRRCSDEVHSRAQQDTENTRPSVVTTIR